MRRKRWEWREQAVVALNLQAEMMGATKQEHKPARNERVFRPNNGGINQGPPPFGAFREMGFDVEM